MSYVTHQPPSFLGGCIVLLAVLSGGVPLPRGEAATTIVVTSLADPGDGTCPLSLGECTLREAIDAAQDGDTIAFHPVLFASGGGIIVLTAEELVLDKDVTLVGPGRHLLALSGNGASHVIRIGPHVTASIAQMTIRRGGETGRGGGVYNAGTLTITRSTISGNAARDGGGVYNTGMLTITHSTIRDNTVGSRDSEGGGIYNTGTLTITHSTISGNTSHSYGGGVYSVGMLTITRSTISGNTGGAGGGISNAGTLTITRSTISDNLGSGVYSAGTLTITDSTISGNNAHAGGGVRNAAGMLTITDSMISGNNALYGGGVSNGGTLTITRSTVRDNTAGGYGGGVRNDNTLTVTRSTISGNTSYSYGGGVDSVGTLTITRSTISGNTAAKDGGGVHNWRGPLTITASTISGNTAAKGGGVWSRLRTQLSTTIIAGNTATTAGPDCYQERPMQSRGHNLTGIDSGCPRAPNLHDLSVDPALVFTQVLEPLGPNGGPTRTHALRPGSPAVDAGDPRRCRGTDQRGVVRPQGDGCDIGAFEAEVP